MHIGVRLYVLVSWTCMEITDVDIGSNRTRNTMHNDEEVGTCVFWWTLTIILFKVRHYEHKLSVLSHFVLCGSGRDSWAKLRMEMNISNFILFIFSSSIFLSFSFDRNKHDFIVNVWNSESSIILSGILALTMKSWLTHVGWKRSFCTEKIKCKMTKCVHCACINKWVIYF